MNHDNPKDLIPHTPDDLASDEADNRQADQVEREIFGGAGNARETAGLISRFVQSYERHKNTQPVDVWLTDEFRQYPGIWKDEEELETTAREIVVTVRGYNASKESLYAHLDAGKSRETWLAKKIEQGAEAAGVSQVGAYATGIDDALKTATADMWNTVTIQSGIRRRGEISNAYNLDGFIAEQHHADTFNIEAASRGSEYRAEVLKSNVKNSPDIVIRDGQGNIVERYQAKYGADADTTQNLLDKGDYLDQKKLVPSEQAGRIEGASDVIEIDGITSKPLSKAEAKELQKQAQDNAEARQYAWNDVNRVNVAKQIGKQALIGACVGAGLQGARILGRRAWNWVQGRENPPASEDLKEFFHDSIKGAQHVGAQVAVSGAVVVAAKNGLLGQLLKNTPAGRITSAVYIGLENARILFKLAKGELSGPEALDAMGVASSSALGGLAGAGLGMAQGAALGLVFGPVGAAVGGFVGGVVGGMAGSTIGDALYQGGKVVVKTAAKVLNTLTEGLKEAAATVARNLNPLNWFA